MAVINCPSPLPPVYNFLQVIYWNPSKLWANCGARAQRAAERESKGTKTKLIQTSSWSKWKPHWANNKPMRPNASIITSQSHVTEIILRLKLLPKRLNPTNIYPSWAESKCSLRSSQLHKSFPHSPHLLETLFMKNTQVISKSSPPPEPLFTLITLGKPPFMNSSKVIFRVLSSSQVLSALITVVEFYMMSS